MPQLNGSAPPNASGALAIPQDLWHKTPAFGSPPLPRHTVAQLTETQQPNGSDTLRLAQLVCDRTARLSCSGEGCVVRVNLASQAASSDWWLRVLHMAGTGHPGLGCDPICRVPERLRHYHGVGGIERTTCALMRLCFCFGAATAPPYP